MATNLCWFHQEAEMIPTSDPHACDICIGIKEWFKLSRGMIRTVRANFEHVRKFVEDQFSDEKPVPRLERDAHSDELTIITSVGAHQIEADLHAAIWGLTGKEILVYQPPDRWEKLSEGSWGTVWRFSSHG